MFKNRIHEVRQPVKINLNVFKFDSLPPHSYTGSSTKHGVSSTGRRALPMTPKTRFTIGRDRGCDIPIADDSVSRLHAEITLLDGGRVFLTDCHSSNSTFVMRDGK